MREVQTCTFRILIEFGSRASPSLSRLNENLRRHSGGVFGCRARSNGYGHTTLCVWVCTYQGATKATTQFLEPSTLSQKSSALR